MSEGVAELFGRLLLALPDLPAVDHHVMLVGNAVDADQAERKRFEARIMA